MITIKPTPLSNRRKASRKVARSSINVECRRGAVGLGKNLVTQFLDISEGGVRVTVKEFLAPGSEVEIILLGSHLGKPIKRLAKVCWSLPLENSLFCVGLAFDKRLAFAEVSHVARP